MVVGAPSEEEESEPLVIEGEILADVEEINEVVGASVEEVLWEKGVNKEVWDGIGDRLEVE